MRRILAITAPFALLALPLALAACGEGGALDENLKSTLRQSLVASCTATAQGQIPEGVSVDVSTVCTCATACACNMAGCNCSEQVAPASSRKP